MAHGTAEGNNNVISWTVTKKEKKNPLLGWISRLSTLLVELQLDARLSLAWSHYITYSLQLSSVMACFMWPDSLYTDIAVNTYCQCLNKNFPYHHVYQDKCVARYSLLPELILAEHSKCHLSFLKGLLWSSHLALKTIEHGWMDPDAFPNRSYRNMENSFNLSSIILFQGYSDMEQEIQNTFALNQL